MKIELSHDQVYDLMTILGAARGLFQQVREDETMPGIMQALLRDWENGAHQLANAIVEQHNRETE